MKKKSIIIFNIILIILIIITILYSIYIKIKNRYIKELFSNDRKKIAIGFYGITRSLNYTIDSIEKNIFNVLKENNFDYDIFLHTYNLDEYKNTRANEEYTKNIDNNQYKLLKAKYLKIDNQNEVKSILNLESYRNKPDPWNTNYESVDFYILGKYSQYSLTKMIENSKNDYDYILFIRPDCLYLDRLDVSKFNLINDNTILIPSFALYGEYRMNDRFAITNNKTYKIYGKIFEELLELSNKYPLHSETILGMILEKNNIENIKIKFNFARIRSDGKVAKRDINDLKKYNNILKNYT
jgi:hypothetical protein